MFIKFTADAVLIDGKQGGPEQTKYKAGQVVEMTAPSANRWIQRGVAVELTHPPEPEVLPIAKPATVEKSKWTVKRASRTRNSTN